jgi:CheY-like chemotaxis protein
VSARIVIADDEADIRGLIAFMLRRRGYTVAEASTGDEALAIIRSERTDLALLDVMMPGLSGIEVARELGADPSTRDMPIVLLSAKGQAAEIEVGLASGVRAYVVKPFTPKELAAQIAEILAAPPVPQDV